ncbi:MAG: phosphoribosylglycinamide formyltransferase [Alphaproteobacteria bacterium]|nr:phosphoribosylglycinamide formyltransferase [Alphaproteobacteria bacterium]
MAFFMKEGKLQLAVFISGNGSNLQALIDACAAPDFPARIALVLSNRPGVFGVKRAKRAGIETALVDHKTFPTRAAFEQAIAKALEGRGIDLICLAGFMRILTADFLSQWAEQVINTHPSLLPRHGGPGMFGEHVHRAVLDSGDTQSGATIHYVIPEVDQGPVILQKTVPVLPGDTVETLAERVIAQEHKAYPEAVRMIAEKQRETS